MSDTKKSGKAPKSDAREDRLKAALKANMARRKGQARARAANDTSDETKTDQKEA